MRSSDFWRFFDHIARPRLAWRADSFGKVFSYLDRLDRPVVIVETGCVRRKEAWEADGQSTILFDKYAEFHSGSLLLSVDIDPAATALCRSLVRPEVQIHTGDSVAFLRALVDARPPQAKPIDLLYLDSFDVDLHNPLPSANHALKELLTAAPLLSHEALVVVDNSPLSLLGTANPDGSMTLIDTPRTGGKGRLISEYATQTGAELYFADYQSAWLGFGRRAESCSVTGGGAASRAVSRQRRKMSELALRMAVALPRVERALLALLLLEGEAEEITFRRRNGTRWTAFPWDHVTSETLFVDGDFQGPELRALVGWLTRHCRFAAPRNVVFDLGAKIGTSTIPIARQTGCRIVAVEAVPEMFTVLCRNVADNGLASRVICVQAAIDRSVSGHFQIILPAGTGGGEVSRPDWESSLARQSLSRGTAGAPAIGLSCLLDAYGITPHQVAFVWSDTQGCECEVIQTGCCLWAAGVPLFAKFDPTHWGGPVGLATLVNAATGCFAGFIPAEMLIAAADPKPRAIAELANFRRTIDSKGTEILLLPQKSRF
jgi:FkbM family methyltransferase